MFDTAALLDDPDMLEEALRLPDHSQAFALMVFRSRVDAAALQRGAARPAPGLYRSLERASARRTQLAAAPSPGTELEQIQRRRLSERFYEDRPVAGEVLAAVIAAAGFFDRDAWPEHQAGAPLQFLVAARRVAGLAPAIYLADPATGTFSETGVLPSGDAAADLVLQAEFADASAILIACGPLAASLDRHGDHGHRLLLTRAGAAVHAASLTAMDHGLTGSIFAGFLSAGLRSLRVDGYYTAQLLALAIGHPRAAAPHPSAGGRGAAAEPPGTIGAPG